MAEILPNPSSSLPTDAPPASALTHSVPGAPVSDPKAPPAVAVKPEPSAEPKVSSKLQMLVRREKQANERISAAKTKEEQITAREKALEAREARITEFESIKKTNPRKALELMGLSYQDLTMAELNDGIPTPDVQVRTLEDKFDSLKQELADKAKADAEAQTAAAKADEQLAMQNHQREIDGFIAQNGKKYELIQFEGQQKLVFSVINAHYERTIDPKTGIGKIMTIEEASDKVEAFLEAKYNKALDLEKFKTRLVPVKPPAKLITNSGPKPPTKTLSNTMSGNAGTPRARLLTDEERIQKAIAYAHGLRPQG